MEARDEDSAATPSGYDLRRRNTVSLNSTPTRPYERADRFSACISGVLRIYYTVINQESPDVTWNYKGVAWATSLETGSGIVIASLPVMPRLVMWLWDRDNTGIGSSRFPKSSRSYHSNKLRRLGSESTNPPSLVHNPASNVRRLSNSQGIWIPLQDEPSKSVRVDERAARPTSQD